MDEPSIVQRMPWSTTEQVVEPLLTREWLVTNGLGGYASGTVGGAPTRRYHGSLIAALPAPHGRMMMLSYLSERVCLPDGRVVPIGGEERKGSALALPTASVLDEFRLESGLPVWRCRAGDAVIEKRMAMPFRQNTLLVRYRLLEGPPTARLELRPALHFRGHDAMVDTPDAGTHVWTIVGDRYEVSAGEHLPPLRLRIAGLDASFTHAPQSAELRYRAEEARGYPAIGGLWFPGHFAATLVPGGEVVLVASTESWTTLEALGPAEADRAEHERRRRLVAVAHPAARTGFGAELVLAADQFVISPATRTEDATRARAVGDDARTVIAGYHWFTDWGRDTMIALEGLTLCTGRYAEAGYILRTFAHYVRDGLIPNMFPEGENQGLYHTADATLWFFHALARYVAATGDRDTLQQLVPVLHDIVAHHVRGTRFGIGVDPNDGLLRQGAPGYQLTWMDAKVDDWVVTPRRGKAVEINALWYNALRLLEGWERAGLGTGGAAAADELARHAERARIAFHQRFWFAEGGHLYDVVDGEAGDDPACRPNQVFAISLDHAILDPARWAGVLGVVRDRLLTPVGLRSLAPGHADYKARYDGDLRARDAAYHQGTVWAWLIGPMVDAWLRVYPTDRAGARTMLEGFPPHLGEACIGTISEVFDAEAPFTPRGCIAQAWSVGEVLRAWVRTA